MAAVIALAGCSIPNPFDRGAQVTGTPLATGHKVPPGQEELASFYNQSVT